MEGLDAYQQERNRIAPAILGLRMPVMSGGECLKKILKIDLHTKVIVATGSRPTGKSFRLLRKGPRP